MGTRHLTNWDEIERMAIAGVDFPELEKRFGIKQNTLRARARRHKWATPSAIALRAKQLRAKAPSQVGGNFLDAVAEDWNAQGEAHRKSAFEIANKSLKKFRIKAPKNFRELKAADDIARRAAGLDISEVNQQTLIMMHERVNQFDDQPEEIVEAEIIPEEPNALPPDQSQSHPEIESPAPPVPVSLPDQAPVLPE